MVGFGREGEGCMGPAVFFLGGVGGGGDLHELCGLFGNS